MTKPEAPVPAAEPESSTTAVAEAPTPPPAPEPPTPEKVAAWNRYLDRYLVAGVLLLVVLASIRPISHSSIWVHLRTGELITRGGPVVTDPFSYTREGQTWVNIPWVFQAINWLLYSAGGPNWGPTLLVLVNALVVGLAGIVLLGVRHSGPGLWWAAIALMVALGGSFMPAGAQGIQPVVGGLSYGRIRVDPETWGLALLAVELLLLHRALQYGSRAALFALPVLFLIWANVDSSFVFGLVVLAASTIGTMIRPPMRPEGAAPPPTPPLALGVLAGCVVVCLLNPSLWRVFAVAADPFAQMVGNLTGSRQRAGLPLTHDLLSFFGSESTKYYDQSFGPGTAGLYQAHYFAIVGIALATFVLNRRRFAAGRFLAFLAAALLWAGLSRLAPFFALVFAATITLNGQEWYQGAYGTRGRLGAAWKIWSDGGRAVMVVVIFALLANAITGYASPEGEPPLRPGSDLSGLALREAEFLRDADFGGRVLNLRLDHGDALIWADPRHKTFIDSRQGVFDDELRLELRSLRQALSRDDYENYAPILSKYDVAVVMVSPDGDAPVYRGLLRSPSFVPVFDGGNAVLFGRVDRDDADRALFRTLQLDPDTLAFRRNAELSVPDRPPTTSDPFDRVLRHRALRPPEPEVSAALRWLSGTWGGTTGGGTGQALEPASCLLAIREARAALVRNPDDSRAFLVLQAAYEALIQAELAILNRPRSTDGTTSGEADASTMIRVRSPQALNVLTNQTPTTPGPIVDAFQQLQSDFLNQLLADGQAEASLASNPMPQSLMGFRYRQRLAALNFAIETTPPPRAPDARKQLAQLNLELAGLYQQNQARDLARDRLAAARELTGPAAFGEQLQVALDQLDEQIYGFRDEMDNQSAANPEQDNPLQRAVFAEQFGFPGIAIEELRTAEREGIAPAQVRPLLIDLYCRIGRPDEAFDLLETSPQGDPSLATGPGMGQYRQGSVYLLLGYYPNAVAYWSSPFLPGALPELSRVKATTALSAARGTTVGDPMTGVRSVLELTGSSESPGLIGTSAIWETEVGLALLESGRPQDQRNERGEVIARGAGYHLRRALEIDPESPTRPLIEYYLEKLGVEVPAALPEESAPDVDAVPSTEDASAEVPNPDAPPAEDDVKTPDTDDGL